MKLSLKTIKTLIREELKKIEGDAETEEEMHIFDFDDTLGVTNAMTLVTGIEKISDNDYRVIKDLDKRIKGNGIESSTVTDKTDLIGAFNQYLRGSGKSSSHLPKQFGDLAGAEVAVLDTDAYAKWKNNYKPVNGGKLFRGYSPLANSGGLTQNTLRTIKNFMAGAPVGSELLFQDYSPSFTLGQVEPVDIMIDKAKEISNSPEDSLGVITARRGEKSLDNFGGQHIQAQNAEDIKVFLKSKNISPDFVYGASDFGTDIPALKKQKAKEEWLNSNDKHLFFYDDDQTNADHMMKLCDDPDISQNKEGGSISVWSNNFRKDGLSKTPKKKCVIRKVKKTFNR